MDIAYILTRLGRLCAVHNTGIVSYTVTLHAECETWADYTNQWCSLHIASQI